MAGARELRPEARIVYRARQMAKNAVFANKRPYVFARNGGTAAAGRRERVYMAGLIASKIEQLFRGMGGAAALIERGRRCRSSLKMRSGGRAAAATRYS